MKTNSLFTLTTLLLSTTLLASAQAAPSKVWVARLTGETQCERNVRRSSLADAIAELEKDVDHADVTQAMVAKLKGQMFCSSCDCPAGNFFVAELQSADQHGLDLEQLKDGWTVVNPALLQKGDSSASNEAHILPVNPPTM